MGAIICSPTQCTSSVKRGFGGIFVFAKYEVVIYFFAGTVRASDGSLNIRRDFLRVLYCSDLLLLFFFRVLYCSTYYYCFFESFVLFDLLLLFFFESFVLFDLLLRRFHARNQTSFLQFVVVLFCCVCGTDTIIT